MMPRLIAIWLLFTLGRANATAVPLLRVADTINPGSADYLISQIQKADESRPPFVLILLDTPGGLLTSTRQIVQAMLSSATPIVVFVGPKGAHAGSAGAIITFAADVAAMAPGTNIGAAHPVSSGGDAPDGPSGDKVTNDTAAFAESLARTKGRNAGWAIESVKSSASLSAEEALKHKVVDLIAEDVPELLLKLRSFSLNRAKGNVARLPNEKFETVEIKTSLKQRAVSFFADPSLAYLIMSLGALCLWIELSHPGLIAPGVIGGLCVLLSLVSFQLLPISYGALGLMLLGLGLMVAEIFVPSFGILGIGGIASFLVGSTFLMDTTAPQFQLSLALILPTAAVLATFTVLLGWLVLKSRRAQESSSGFSALIAKSGIIKEAVLSGATGLVLVEGELWKARAESGVEIPVGAAVVVQSHEAMVLIVRPVQ